MKGFIGMFELRLYLRRAKACGTEYLFFSKLKIACDVDTVLTLHHASQYIIRIPMTVRPSTHVVASTHCATIILSLSLSLSISLSLSSGRDVKLKLRSGNRVFVIARWTTDCGHKYDVRSRVGVT